MTSTTWSWSLSARRHKTESSLGVSEKNIFGRTQHAQLVQTSRSKDAPRCHQELQVLSPFTKTWNPDLSQRRLADPGLSRLRLSRAAGGDGLHAEMALLVNGSGHRNQRRKEILILLYRPMYGPQKGFQPIITQPPRLNVSFRSCLDPQLVRLPLRFFIEADRRVYRESRAESRAESR